MGIYIAEDMVKAYEPYQMLGFIDEALKQAMRIDVEGISLPLTIFAIATTTGSPGACRMVWNSSSLRSSVPAWIRMATL